MSDDDAKPTSEITDEVVSDRIDLECPICHEMSTHDRASVHGFTWHCEQCNEAIYSFHHGQWFISEGLLLRAGAAVMRMTVEQARTMDQDPTKAAEVAEILEQPMPSLKRLGEAMDEVVAEASRRPPSDN